MRRKHQQQRQGRRHQASHPAAQVRINQDGRRELRDHTQHRQPDQIPEGQQITDPLALVLGPEAPPANRGGQSTAPDQQ